MAGSIERNTRGRTYAFWIVRRHGADTNPVINAFCRWLRKEAARTDIQAAAIVAIQGD
jgi:LysR family glycine cleavage system transcriptional activator